ncbi:MAG: hypothetical protein ABW166_20320 [Sedimenticola sp.]
MNTLERGEGVLLAGLRRTGKSWAMKEALARLHKKNPGGLYLYLDIQDLSHPSALFLKILDALPKNATDHFYSLLAKTHQIPSRLVEWLRLRVSKGNAAGTGVEFQKGVTDYWKPLSNAIEKVLPQTEARAVLGLDEVPFFLENLIAKGYTPEFISEILATLRRWRESGVGMVIGGSISLEHQLDSLGIPRTVLGGLFPVDIRPLSTAESLTFLTEGAKSSGLTWWSEETGHQVIREVGDGVPYFLRFALDHLSTAASAEEVEECLHNQVLPGLHRAFLYQFDERLSRRYSSGERYAAECVLDLLCRKQEGATIVECQSVLEEPDVDIYGLLTNLQRDDFIRFNPEQHYLFSLRLLRRWWCGRRGVQG